MAPRVRTLTVNLRDISDLELTEGQVTVQLTGADEALPVPGVDPEPGRQILPNPKSAEIAAGTVTFDLIPTGQLKGGQLYSINFGAGSINFRMPDQDISLYDLLATSPVAPDLPSVLGANPPDGTMAAIRNNQWIRYNPIWVADTEPAVFFTNRTLWLDTSGGGQQLKYRGAAAWVDIAGGGGGGGLTQSQVDARVAALVRPYARSTFANLDSLGTADIEDADGLLWFDQSDSAEGKKLTYGAFRARVADDEVADWAQEGNTDDIPAGKLTNAPSGGGGLTQAQVDARIADWAETGNTEDIPADKLGNARGGPGFVPFNRHTLTVGDGPLTGTVDRGYQSAAAGTQYGALSPLTYEGADGNTYTLQALSTVAPQAVRVLLTGRPPRTGDDSILRESLIIGGVATPFSAAFAEDGTVGALQSTSFTFSGLAHLIPAVGSTVEVSIGGAIDRYLDLLETTDLADVASTAPTDGQVPTWSAANSEYRPATPAAGGGGLTQAQVDARADLRVAALVEDWAETANPTTRIPRSKLPVADAEVYIARSPAANVALTNDSSDGSFGAWTTVATLPALASTEAGRLRLDAKVLLDSSADARTAGGGSRIGAEVRIVRTRSSADDDLDTTSPVYGPRNLSNGSTEFQSTNQRAAAAVWVYDNARTGDVYKLEARVATQETRAITVQATTDSRLVAFRAASGGGSGGVGGQTGGSHQVAVYLWRRAASTPAAPAGGDWDTGGWTDLPTGWYASPGAVPSASGQSLYRAVGRAQFSGAAWTVGDWTVEATSTFNTQYSDSLNGASPYPDARASSVAFNSRLPDGSGWSSEWIPLAVLPDWTYLGEITLDTSNTGSAKIITFPAPFDLYDMKDLRWELSLWQSAGSLINFASTVDTGCSFFGVEDHNRAAASPAHSNSILSVVLESDDGLRVMAGSGTSLPTSTETAGVKGYFRRQAAGSSYGTVGSFYVAEFSRTTMRGYLRLRVR